MADKVREIGTSRSADFETRKAAFEREFIELCRKYRMGFAIRRTEVAQPARPLHTDFGLDAVELDKDQIEALAEVSKSPIARG